MDIRLIDRLQVTDINVGTACCNCGWSLDYDRYVYYLGSTEQPEYLCIGCLNEK